MRTHSWTDMAAKTDGLLIVFEGIDGTGKSTQIAYLETYLQENGYRVTTTREPTHGRYGVRIRELYQNRQGASLEEELELFLLDRREHVQTIITPSLEQGQIVLCDRYFLSTAAYQGAAGLDPQRIIEQNHFAPDPDLAIILEIDVEESIKRITVNRGDSLNDFEQLESLKKVDKIFKSLQHSYIRRIDGSQTISQVRECVRKLVADLLSKRYGTTEL